MNAGVGPGEWKGEALLLEDRAAELHALASPLNDKVERAEGDAGGLGADHQTRPVQRRRGKSKAAAFDPENGAVRHDGVEEHEVAGRYCPGADAGLATPDADPRLAEIHQEGGDSAISRPGI